MNIRRTRADALFSEFIRNRDGWKCRKCGKQFEKGAQNLHSAHIYSRRHYATRHCPANAIALCFTDHQYFTENPVEFARWCDEEFGEEVMDKLYAMSHSVEKKSKVTERLRVEGLKAMVARQVA